MTDQQWQELVDRFVDGDVTPGHMFGCAGLRTGRRFFAIRWDEQLVAKLPPARLAALVEAGDGRPFEPMEGRRMNGWLVLDDRPDPEHLVEEARAYVAGLA
jgi:TfoX N-terminal domain